MSDKELYTKCLILGVTHLCERTRQLARHPHAGFLVVMPVRESLELLQRTVRELERALTVDAAGPDASWLLEADDLG